MIKFCNNSLDDDEKRVKFKGCMGDQDRPINVETRTSFVDFNLERFLEQKLEADLSPLTSS